MRRRLVLLFVLAAAAGGTSCSSHEVGPTAPGGPDQVTPDDAVKATGARAAAHAFVDAYAAATGPDSASLRTLAGTDLLRGWVHWLDVQNREFPGTITGSVSTNQIGPAAPFSVSSVPGSEAILRQVEVAATVTFSFDPSAGSPVTVTRSLDGPMRLILDPKSGWKVLDFTRDGIPLSREFQVVNGATASKDGLRIEVVSFLSVPYWEFGLVVTDRTSVSVASKKTALVDANGSIVAAARAVTSSLDPVAAGSPVEGIVTFPAQASADGLTLRLVLRVPGAGVTALDIPLKGLIDPVPISTSSPTPSG